MQTNRDTLLKTEPFQSSDFYLEAFEQAMADELNANLLEFIPPEEHPDYQDIACEMVRIDLEYGFERNNPKPLQWYKHKLPKLFQNDIHEKAIDFELERLEKIYPELSARQSSRNLNWLKDLSNSSTLSLNAESSILNTNDANIDQANNHQASDPLFQAATLYQTFSRTPLPEGPIEWKSFFRERNLKDERVEKFSEACAENPKLAQKLAKATISMPKVGDRFLDFFLVSSLGRGSFGQVFLARQGDLANRTVALKVTADIGGEVQNLAQLQHTNVIPVYSVHRIQNLRAVCMPFLGAATLADLVSQVKRKSSLPSTWAELAQTIQLDESGTIYQGSTKSAISKQKSIPSTPHSSDATPSLDKKAESDKSLLSLHHALGSARLRELGYVPAILWIMKRICEGLSHAHARGIVHRDLKPANILFTDEGEPVLLDFNLATDTKEPLLRQIGGTLPYMAPEQLDALQNKDLDISVQCDIYSLGVIFYELLTGKLPFENRSGRMNEILPLMIADRQKLPPSPHRFNSQVTPATIAILNRCINPDPAKRYSTTDQLIEDLDRQLNNLPLVHTSEPSPRERLQKWARRHPRITSSTGISILSGILISCLLLVYFNRERQYQRIQSKLQYQTVRDQWPEIVGRLLKKDPLDEEQSEGIQLCQSTLQPYMNLRNGENWTQKPLVADLPPMEKADLTRSASELFFLWSKTLTDKLAKLEPSKRVKSDVDQANSLLELSRQGFQPNFPDPLQKLDKRLQALSGNPSGIESDSSAIPSITETSNSSPTTAQSLATAKTSILELADSLEGIDDRKMLDLFKTLNKQKSDSPFTWVLLGDAFARNGKTQDAQNNYDIAIALQKDQVWARVHRGILALERKDFPSAISDFDEVIKLRPNLSTGWINLAIAKLNSGDAEGALKALDDMKLQGNIPTRVGFIRARCLEKLGRKREAIELKMATLKLQPDDELSWIARGTERLPSQPQEAIHDFESALQLNPKSLIALQNIAAVRSEFLGETGKAIESLNDLIKNHPQYVPARSSRGVLLARLGKTNQAITDAKEALRLSGDATLCYQVAGIFALSSKQDISYKSEAYNLLSQAFKSDKKWINLAMVDPDLAPLRSDPKFDELVKASSILYKNMNPNPNLLSPN